MKQRLNVTGQRNEGVDAMRAVEAWLSKTVDHKLLALVKMRASQINGCAYCIDMHARDARHGGESEQRLYLLSAWEETSLYSEREQAALRWTECLTRLPTDGAPDDVYAAMQAQFTPLEIANLTTLIGLINLWNRFGVGFRLQLPAQAKAA